MTIDLHLLPSWPQSQDSLKSQMVELIQVANRLGLYDAATFLSQRSTAASPPEPPTDEALNYVYQSAYQPAWERGEVYGAHYDGLRAIFKRWC